MHICLGVQVALVAREGIITFTLKLALEPIEYASVSALLFLAV